MKKTAKSYQLFFEGDDYYSALRHDIASASRCVLIESYILENDEIGLEIIESLIAAARRGVLVRIIADGVGSYSLHQDAIRRMRAEKIELSIFRPLGWFGMLSIRNHRRSHRKLVVIDGNICFAGGMNIVRDHSRRAVGHESWRDSMIRLVGRIAMDAELSFDRMWRFVSGRRLVFPRSRPAGVVYSSADLQLIENTPRFRLAFRRAYRDSLASAQKRIWIESAYFIPTLSFLRLLKRKARAGVDVRLLVSEKSDVKAAFYASRFVFSGLLKAGVRIYEVRARFVHSKALVVDDRISIVGSANLDHRSFLHDLELSIRSTRPDINHDLAHQFSVDASRARLIDGVEWGKRPFTVRLLERWFFLFKFYL